MSSPSILQKQAIHGTAWTILGYGSSQFIRLCSNLILTRLLVPEMFGLMALTSTFLTGLTLFSDMGLRASIIRNKRGDDPDFLNTAWTLQIIRGFGLWLCCLIIAVPVSRYYEEPHIVWILPVAGLTTILAGFKSTDVHRLTRHMAIRKLAIFDASTQLVGIVAMIIWAYLSPSIWALLVGGLVSNLFAAICSHFLYEGKFNRLKLEREALNELIRFGRWIFVATAISFLASQADKLFLGKLLSIEMLGVYTIAFSMAYLIRAVIVRINRQVTLPVLSRLTHLAPEEVKKKILPKRQWLLIGLSVFIALFAGFGDYLILFLYDSRYEQASWMLPMLVLGLWPLLLSMTVDQTLYAVGKPMYSAFGNALKLAYMIILMPIGNYYWGVFGVILVITLNDLPYYAISTFGLCVEKFNFIRQDIKMTALLSILCGLVLTCRYVAGFGTPFDLLFHS